jgi:hypothetical protein
MCHARKCRLLARSCFEKCMQKTGMPVFIIVKEYPMNKSVVQEYFEKGWDPIADVVAVAG